MQVMVARFVILLVSSILVRSPTSDYVNSITDGVLSLASNFSSCCFQRLVCQLNPYLDTILGLLGEAHIQILGHWSRVTSSHGHLLACFKLAL